MLESDVGAILPDRRLMQTFEHPQAGLNRFFAGPLPDCIPNFEEFAKLFGLALPSPKSKAHKAGDSSGRSRKASTGSSASSTGEIPKLSPLMASSDLKSDKRGVSHSSALKHVTKALMDKGKISSGSELAKPSKGKSVKSSRTSIQEDKDGELSCSGSYNHTIMSGRVLGRMLFLLLLYVILYRQSCRRKSRCGLGSADHNLEVLELHSGDASNIRRYVWCKLGFLS